MITSSLAAVGGVSVFRVSRASSSHSFMMNRNIVVVLVFVLVAGAIHVDDLMSACPPLPPHTPQDINDLSPSDIKVVMALGDSITAAFGLEGIEGGIDEFRGQSWDIGGDPGAVTVYNLMKQYSPNVVGGALGKHIVELCYGPDICPPLQYRPTEDVFDAAQSGAWISNLVDHEMDYLMKVLSSNPNVSMENDWKLLTVFIGANDLCISCTKSMKNYTDADNFEAYMRALLERVRSEIPRTFVNLVPIFNISGVYYLSLQSTYCTDLHRVFDLECDCIFTPDAQQTRIEIDTFGQLYNQRMFSIAADYASRNYTDFAVVVQPFGLDTDIRQLPLSFLSTLDCFHPSLSAHQTMAIALWNNLLTPAAQKETVLDTTATPICPTAESRLATN